MHSFLKVGKTNEVFAIFYKSLGFFFRLSELFFNPLLARRDIGAGVEQPFGCLIVQNRQAM